MACCIFVNDGGRYPIENNVDCARNADGVFIEHFLRYVLGSEINMIS